MTEGFIDLKNYDGIVKLRLKRDATGHDRNYNAPKRLTVSAGEIVTIHAKNGTTRLGDLFFDREDGSGVDFDKEHVVTTAPYGFCKGYLNPDTFEVVR